MKKSLHMSSSKNEVTNFGKCGRSLSIHWPGIKGNQNFFSALGVAMLHRAWYIRGSQNLLSALGVVMLHRRRCVQQLRALRCSQSPQPEKAPGPESARNHTGKNLFRERDACCLCLSYSEAWQCVCSLVVKTDKNTMNAITWLIPTYTLSKSKEILNDCFWCKSGIWSYPVRGIDANLGTILLWSFIGEGSKRPRVFTCFAPTYMDKSQLCCCQTTARAGISQSRFVYLECEAFWAYAQQGGVEHSRLWRQVQRTTGYKVRLKHEIGMRSFSKEKHKQKKPNQ